MATGWTYEYIDEFVTLPRLAALDAHWAKHPPVHMSVAAFAGIKMQAPPTQAVAAAPARVIPIDNAAIWRDVHSDPRTLRWTNMTDRAA